MENRREQVAVGGDRRQAMTLARELGNGGEPAGLRFAQGLAAGSGVVEIVEGLPDVDPILQRGTRKPALGKTIVDRKGEALFEGERSERLPCTDERARIGRVDAEVAEAADEGPSRFCAARGERRVRGRAGRLAMPDEENPRHGR